MSTTVSATTDRISLIGLSARGHHGVLPFEREEGQLFTVDVILDLGQRGTAVAAVTDSLTDAVDYSRVANGIVSIIEGEPVHGLGVAAPVLADVDDAGTGDEAVHGRVGQAAGDVVDDVGAGVDGGLGGGGVDGVHRDDRAAVAIVGTVGEKCAHHRQDAGDLSVDVDPLGAGTGGLPADVDDVGALGDELTGVGHSGLGIGPTAAVGEGVGGDVEDAHEERPVAGHEPRQGGRGGGGKNRHRVRLTVGPPLREDRNIFSPPQTESQDTRTARLDADGAAIRAPIRTTARGGPRLFVGLVMTGRSLHSVHLRRSARPASGALQRD